MTARMGLTSFVTRFGSGSRRASIEYSAASLELTW
jgi:hypothetical protein